MSSQIKRSRTYAKTHHWVTVVNPVNSRMLLQACDDCGVVKSENSVIRHCKANPGLGVISKAEYSGAQLAG